MTRRAGQFGLTAGLAALLLGACAFGAISQDEFTAAMVDRSGGIVGDLGGEVVDAVADDQAVTQPRFVRLGFHTGYVSVEVAVPGSSDLTDSYSYSHGVFRRGGLLGPDPNDAWDDSDPLESVLFSPDEAGLDQIDAIVDDALARAEQLHPDFSAAHVTMLSVSRREPGRPPEINVSVETERRETRLTYAPDGSLTEEPQL